MIFNSTIPNRPTQNWTFCKLQKNIFTINLRRKYLPNGVIHFVKMYSTAVFKAVQNNLVKLNKTELKRYYILQKWTVIDLIIIVLFANNKHKF